MKTLASILFILFFSVASLNAQIKVFSNGNTKVGYTSNTPSSLLTIGNTAGETNSQVYVHNSITGYLTHTKGITVISPIPSTFSNSTGIFGQALLSSTGTVQKARGVYGYAYIGTATDRGRSYGVYGVAGNATSGYNYGVYGWLAGTNNGAAVYGSITGDDVNTTGRYAGFFDGPVYVRVSGGAFGMIVRDNGIVGIGQWPGDVYKLQVFGTAWCQNGMWEQSDSSTKKEIKKLTKDNYTSLYELSGVTYKFKKPAEIKNNQDKQYTQTSDTGSVIESTVTNPTEDVESTALYDKTVYGFVAQDVEKIFPDLVFTDKNGLKSIRYNSFIPLIVETLKEQHLVIDTLRRENEFFKQQLSTCCVKNQLKSMAALSDESINSGAVLYQNMPNSFSEKTEIKYVLPDNTGSAMICVYDMQGKQLKCYNIAGSGENSITIYGNELSAGMYLYTLIVNGKEVDTKRMILTN